VSWGILPVFAGSIIQVNTVSIQTLVLSGVAAALSFILIKTSKKYKKLIRESHVSDTHREEIVLKLVSIGVIACTCFYIFLRYA
jgi:heme/copper-type cytochrome/quinol oxidase subunit 2